MPNQRLELTWVGKYDPENKINPEPRILIEKPEYSYAAEVQGQIGLSENKASAENMLIHGDNLLALKSLQQDYAGRVSAVVIDPPYNSHNAFEHYDDNLEHSTWLSLIKPRLELLKMLLTDNGSIWICIDDDEHAYLKVLCDEVFGRHNFVATVLWQKIHSIKNDVKYLSVNHDFILVYAKDKDKIAFNLLPRTDAMNSRYQNIDNDPRGAWQSGDLVANEERANGYYDVVSPATGKTFNVQKGKHWVYSQENMEQMIAENRLWFGKDGNAFPRKKRFLGEVMQGRKGDTWWTSDEVGHNQEAKREAKIFNPSDIFATPKPERLIERILTLATSPGDLILDSFLGSGTTAAVAHKMGRRWIGIELGDHAYTHCYPRLKAVVDGEQGGISKAVKWQGGGGFKFYELAPTLLTKSEYGNLVVSDQYNKEMLAQAMAKHEGYTYAPDENCFWKQGYSGENNFIFTTTGHISPEYLDNIASQLQAGEYMLVCAKSFDAACLTKHKNVIVRHIPRMLLGRCEWGKDNYDLNIILANSDDWGEE